MWSMWLQTYCRIFDHFFRVCVLLDDYQAYLLPSLGNNVVFVCVCVNSKTGHILYCFLQGYLSASCFLVSTMPHPPFHFFPFSHSCLYP